MAHGTVITGQDCRVNGVWLLQELAAMWRELIAALVADDKPLIAERALLFVYYW